MKAVMVAAVLLTLCGAMPTKAQTPGPFPFAGNDLMPACEAADYMNITRSYLNLSKEMIAQAGVCMGQMDAILYFNQTLALSAGNKPCIPIGTTTDQLLSNVVNYLRAHPEERHLNFMLLAMKATNNTWHCGEGRAQ